VRWTVASACTSLIAEVCYSSDCDDPIGAETKEASLLAVHLITPDAIRPAISLLLLSANWKDLSW